MSFFRDLPIRRKLAVIGVVTSAAALLLACTAFVGYEQLAFRRTMTRDLSITARMIGTNSAAALSFDDSDSAEQTLKSLAAQPHIVAACIYDSSGAVFATFQRADGVNTEWPEPRSDGSAFGGDSLRLFSGIALDGDKIGTIYLQSDLDEISARWRRYALITSGVMAFAILASVLIGRRLQRLISEPISLLAGAMAHASEGESRYSVRAEKVGNDELGKLVDGFNDMISQIQARDAELTQAHAKLESRVEERTRELAQEKARFKFIFDSVPVGISWHVPFKNDTHLVNAAHVRLTGVSAEDSLLPGVFKRVSHPDDYARQVEQTERFLGGEIDHISLEKRYLRPDGSMVWVMFNSRMFADTISGEKQSLTTLVDITERKEAEDRLAKSLSVLHATLESTADGILVVNREGRMTNFNRKFAEIWRIPQEVLESGDDTRAISYVMEQLKDPAEFERKVRELYAEPETASFDTLEFNDGRVVERHSQPHRVGGEIVGRVWSFRDVTERKRAEAERETLNRRLLETSRQAGMAEVATSVLHNVGNVLNSVNVSASLVVDELRHSRVGLVSQAGELLQKHASDLGSFFTDDPRGKQFPQFIQSIASHLTERQGVIKDELESLQKNIEHIKEIVAMQQSYSRIAGVVESVAVVDLVEDAVQLNAGALQRHGVKFVRAYRAEPTIMVEKHKVLQILVNLIRNAKYACDDSGRSEKVLKVEIDADEARVRISVVDNGVGIPPENLSRIFSHGFTTRKSGHGFGLHSGALAAKEMGGSLQVFSDGPMTGARFVLELPLSPQEKAA